MKAIALLLAVVPCLAQQCQPDTGKRLALVIGNTNYSSPLEPLPTATYEGRVMADALRADHFEITPVEDAKFPDFGTLQADGFLKKIRPGDIVFLYYSGYAVKGQDDEDDYLLPVNYDPRTDVTQRAFHLTDLLQSLAEKKPGLIILMIEGPRKIGTDVGHASLAGLIEPRLSGAGNVIFAISARQGETVGSLPAPQTSLFTRAVVQRLGEPGMRASEVFHNAKDDVSRDTKGVQNPFVDDVIGNGSFCFREALPVKSVEVTPPKEVIVVKTVAPPPPRFETQVNSRDREEYVHIDGGKFRMGCVPGDMKCDKNERPQHDVTISHAFWMGKNEVPVGAYQRFVDLSPKDKKQKMPTAPTDYSGWRNSSLPMAAVRWDQAKDYCEWAGGRLPTEAEWELAARGGNADEIYPFNSENSRDSANFSGKQGNDQYEFAAPVRKFDPNPFHLFDMAGNVWEWVEDFYSPTYYDESRGAVDPAGPIAGKSHVMRGGSWNSDWREHLRISVRHEGGAAPNVGFRCVLEHTEATKQLLKLP
jgi:sulfatase modifying factor 1